MAEPVAVTKREKVENVGNELCYCYCVIKYRSWRMTQEQKYPEQIHLKTER